MVTCCEHNPCPDKPKHWLSRFRERPWRCTQCGKFWVTRYRSGWVFEGEYEWMSVSPKEIQ